MRQKTVIIETETLEVRRLSDGEICVINNGDMDSSVYEHVVPKIPSAGQTTLDEQIAKRVRK